MPMSRTGKRPQNHGPAIRDALAAVHQSHQKLNAAMEAHRKADLAEREAGAALDLARSNLANLMQIAGLTHVRADGYLVTRATEDDVLITRDHFVSVE